MAHAVSLSRVPGTFNRRKFRPTEPECLCPLRPGQKKVGGGQGRLQNPGTARSLKHQQQGHEPEHPRLWRFLRVCQYLRLFRRVQLLRYSCDASQPFRPIFLGSSPHSFDVIEWFHPRRSDVYDLQALIETEAGRTKTNHRLETVFFTCLARGQGLELLPSSG
jgi:hypothetical protein